MDSVGEFFLHTMNCVDKKPASSRYSALLK